MLLQYKRGKLRHLNCNWSKCFLTTQKMANKYQIIRLKFVIQNTKNIWVKFKNYKNQACANYCYIYDLFKKTISFGSSPHYKNPAFNNDNAHSHDVAPTPSRMPTRIPTLWRPRLQECPRAAPSWSAHAFKNAHAQPQVEAPTHSRMPTRSPKLKRPCLEQCPRAFPRCGAHALKNARKRASP